MSGCCVIRCERPKKIVGPKIFLGGRNLFLGGRKSYLAAEHHNEAAPEKKKRRDFSAWAPKSSILGRPRSKGL